MSTLPVGIRERFRYNTEDFTNFMGCVHTSGEVFEITRNIVINNSNNYKLFCCW